MRKIIFLLLAFFLAVTGARADIIVRLGDADPVTLEVFSTEGGQTLFALEPILKSKYEEVSFAPELGELKAVNKTQSLLFSARPPYVQKNSTPYEITVPPRLVEGKFAVSREFLVNYLGPLTGFEVNVDKAASSRKPRLVLDPGHGGKDPGDGALGQTLAKDLILNFTLALGEKLAAEGWDVSYTRKRDADLDAAKRAGAANNKKPDLFLSITAYGPTRPEAKGFELFYPVEPEKNADPALWYNAQVGHFERSRLLAESLRAVLGKKINSFDRGAWQVPSPLMGATLCPSALLVVGNVSWPREAELFADTPARKAYFDAIAEGLREFWKISPL